MGFKGEWMGFKFLFFIHQSSYKLVCGSFFFIYTERVRCKRYFINLPHQNQMLILKTTSQHATVNCFSSVRPPGGAMGLIFHPQPIQSCETLGSGIKPVLLKTHAEFNPFRPNPLRYLCQPQGSGNVRRNQCQL